MVILKSFFLSVRSEDVRLMLWDTAGQEEFDAITKAYYRGIKRWFFGDDDVYFTLQNKTARLYLKRQFPK